MTRKKRAVYSPEFKREAVRLLEQGDKDTNLKGHESKGTYTAKECTVSFF